MPRFHFDAPDWRPPHRGLFIDRWGTLLELPVDGWTSRFSATRFTRGALDALFRASQAGLGAAVIQDQEISKRNFHLGS